MGGCAWACTQGCARASAMPRLPCTLHSLHTSPLAANAGRLLTCGLPACLPSGMIDRDLKPNSEERRAIALVLKLPPNKPLTAEHKALLWRFRYSLTQASGAPAAVRLGCAGPGRPLRPSSLAAEAVLCCAPAAVRRGLRLMRAPPAALCLQDKRALTKFLKCVDWGDVSEASQVGAAGRAELRPGWRHPTARQPCAQQLRWAACRGVAARGALASSAPRGKASCCEARARALRGVLAAPDAASRPRRAP